MKKSKILYRLLAVMIIFNLIQPAVVASAEEIEPSTELAEPASGNTEHTTHSYANGVCTVCGEAHSPHAYVNPNESGATCSVCGFVHEHSISAGRTCETCAYASAAQPAQPSADTPPDDSEHTTHSYENGVCTVCSIEHTDHTYENSVCTICGKAHTPHEFASSTEAGATCSVCGFSHTDHTYETPSESGAKCSVCGYVHEHSISAGSTCETCGYKPEEQSEDVALSRSQAVQVQVEITWTTMSFTYTTGEWDPATHGYSEGGWQATQSGDGVITVANTGTASANVSLTFSPAMPEVDGSFTPNAVTVAPSDTQTIQFMPTGKPPETFTGGTLGTILINIQAASNASVE